MEFDLVMFTLSPTLEEFDKCRKKDLISIAEFFNVLVPKEAKKQVIKDKLYKKLVEVGILPLNALWRVRVMLKLKLMPRLSQNWQIVKQSLR